MQDKIDRLLIEKRLLKTTAEKLRSLASPSQASLLQFIDDFRLGQNHSREFVEYLIDIAKRDRSELATILGEEDFASLKMQIKYSRARKMEILRGYLMKRRYDASICRQDFVDPVMEKEEKEIIYMRQKGRWLKRCPGTQRHICCNYVVINSISGCPFNCTYCYLHTYLNRPGIAVYNNHEELIKEVQSFFENNPNTYYRIGTGEFSDSLALDKTNGLSEKLIELFAQQATHILELKTKSVEIDHLLGLKHNGKTVFAWSINPEIIIRSEELGTASLEERLNAARRCSDAGYPVAFHFDPIIYYQGWEEDYGELVEKIFSAVEEKNIAWISLGALRYPPEQKGIMERKFPHSRITLGELTIGEDNKLRYLKPIRSELFKKMQASIRSYSKEVYVYLCMESADIWKAARIVNQTKNSYARYFSYSRKD
jgi:spore photoproduct lyase